MQMSHSNYSPPRFNVRPLSMRSRVQMKNILSILVFITSLLCSNSLYALDIVPFNTKNQSPLIQIYGLPSAGNAVLLPSGYKEFHVILDHASNYVDDANAEEKLVLDGETTRITITGHYGLSDNIELGFEIPYVVHGGGFLDSFIIHYHDAFGFSQGGRDKAPRNRLLYRYSRDGSEKIRVDGSSSGLGDVSLTAGFNLYHDGLAYPRAVAFRTMLKLPTGDSGTLRGSGSTDFSCWLTARDDYKLSIGHGTLFAALGFMAMTEGDVLPDQQRHVVGFGSLGMGWSPISWIAFKVQMDAHTAFYKESDLRSLATDALQLVMGVALKLSDRTTLNIAVSEDLATLTSPDVVFHFDLGMRF